jgi:hypothetical protein
MKTALALTLVGMFTASVYALPDYDPFADSVGNLIGNTDFQGDLWYAAGPSGSQPQIVSGSLSLPSGLPAPYGNSVSFGPPTGTGISAKLGLTAVTGGTVYYSFALDITSLGSLGTSGIFIAGFNNTTGSAGSQPTTVGSRLYVRSATGGFNLGINKADGTASDIAWDSGTYSLNSPLFIVGSYNLADAGGSADSSALWINPSPSTFGGATAPFTADTTSAGGDMSTSSGVDVVNSFVLREGNASEPDAILDELRVGTAWADVTPVPEPSTTALAGFGALALVSWYRARRR